MDPVGPNTLVVSGNVANVSLATFVFPVGDLTLRVTPWDVKEPLVQRLRVGPIDVPAWIFSFTLEAVDHNGNVLKALKTSKGTIPVFVALNDTTHGYDINVTAWCPVGCLCWPDILVDYRLFNSTGFATKPWGNGIERGQVQVHQQPVPEQLLPAPLHRRRQLQLRRVVRRRHGLQLQLHHAGAQRAARLQRGHTSAGDLLQRDSITQVLQESLQPGQDQTP